MLKDRRNDKIKVLKMSLQGLTDHGSSSRTPATLSAARSALIDALEVHNIINIMIKALNNLEINNYDGNTL